MAAYNCARYLPEALDSILAQSYANVEIVVVNDGSTDATPSVLNDYAQRHGIRVFTQPNRGQSAALNAGFAESRGSYIKFFDSDDILSPDMLETQVAAIAGNPGKLAYSAWGRFEHDFSLACIKPHPGWHDADSGRDWLIETWRDTEPMYQCALFLIPRELFFRAGGWDERLSLINDFDFFSRLVIQSNGIVFTPNTRLYYRSNIKGSVSSRRSRCALKSGCLSTTLGVQHLLAVEDSPRTRKVSANILQAFALTFYPEQPDLFRPLLAEAKRLGGSDFKPGGGLGFRLLRNLIGWRAAMRLRHLVGRQPC
jgi:glycosyltransferase involved in cell wall biosynthesis